MTLNDLPDRRDTTRALAQVYAFRDCGKLSHAKAAAWLLAQQLRAAGFLPDRLDIDAPALDTLGRYAVADTQPDPLELDASDLLTVGRRGRRHDVPRRWS